MKRVVGINDFSTNGFAIPVSFLDIHTVRYLFLKISASDVYPKYTEV